MEKHTAKIGILSPEQLGLLGERYELSVQKASEAVERKEQEDWQDRVDELQNELVLLQRRASEGNFSLDLKTTSLKRNELHEEYEARVEQARLLRKERVLKTLGSIGLRDGEAIMLNSIATHEYSIGMGDGTVRRDRHEFAMRTGESWLYVCEETPQGSEGYEARARVRLPGFDKIVISSDLKLPFIETSRGGERMRVLEPNSDALKPVGWETIWQPIEAFAARAVAYDLAQRLERLVEDADITEQQVGRDRQVYKKEKVFQLGADEVAIVATYSTPSLSPFESLGDVEMKLSIITIKRSNDREPPSRHSLNMSRLCFDWNRLLGHDKESDIVAALLGKIEAQQPVELEKDSTIKI